MKNILGCNTVRDKHFCPDDHRADNEQRGFYAYERFVRDPA